MRFRKKPLVIEAFQFNSLESVDSMQDQWGESFQRALCPHQEVGSVRIQTLEGIITADLGDWIIRGVKGEFYPCKPDIFEASYEKTDE